MTVYRDILGAPQPKITISRSHDLWRNVSYYCVNSTVKALDERFDTLDSAERKFSAEGWIIVERGTDGYGAPEVTLEHPATRAEAERLDAASKAKWANAKRCFVRYGDLPKCGRSRNHADGSLEAGVSVYRGEQIGDAARALPSSNAELAGAVNFALLGLPLYVVEGDEIGIGSDGEPILANCRIVREVKP